MALIGEATLLYFYFKVCVTKSRIQKNETSKTHTIHVTKKTTPQPHFQRKREAEAEAAEEGSSSSEESSDLESETETLEENNMEAEGKSNHCNVVL